MPWRLAFVVYAVLLTIGTHWPRLQLGTDRNPAPDKLLHLVAFAGFAALLWRTGWLRPAWLACVLALLWTVLDETTQAIPGLQRHISIEDLIAGQLGVVLVLAWGWALGPVGGRINRLRLARQRFMIDELFSRRSTWIVLGTAAALSVIPIILLWPAINLHGLPIPTPFILAGVLAIWFSVALAIGANLWYRETRRWSQRRPCFACGADARTAVIDEHGQGECPSCKSDIHVGQWAEVISPSSSRLVRMAARPFLTAIAVIAGGFVLIHLSVVVHARWLEADPKATLPLTLSQGFRALSPGMSDVIDMAILGLIAAFATRSYRKRLARFHDSTGSICLRCEHDLRETPIHRGLGTCGECGSLFVRLP